MPKPLARHVDFPETAKGTLFVFVIIKELLDLLFWTSVGELNEKDEGIKKYKLTVTE